MKRKILCLKAKRGDLKKNYLSVLKLEAFRSNAKERL